MQLVHNHLGVDALFQWGVVEHNGSHRLGIIAGGWEDSLLAPSDAESTEPGQDGGGGGRDYLKLMSMYVLLLAQATEDAEEEAVEVTEVEGDYRDVIVLGEEGEGEEGGISITEYDEFAYDYPEVEEKEAVSDGGANDTSNGLDFKGLLGVLNPFNWMKNETKEEEIEIDVVNPSKEPEEEMEEEEELFDWPEVMVLGGGDSSLVDEAVGGGTAVDYQADDSEVQR